MRCLAVNTATTILSVSLLEDESCLFHYAASEMRDQGNLLLEHIAAGLEQNSLDYKDMDLLAVVTGPGSFTGIRIGLAALRGISLAAGVPVTGVSSFEMFRTAGAESYNAIAVESWREELYFALFDASGREVFPPTNEVPENFARRLSPLQGGVRICGDARVKLAALCPDARVVGDLADARQVAQVAMTQWRRGEVTARPEPYYLREADVTMPKAIKL